MAKRQKKKAGQVYNPNVLLKKTRLRMDEAAAVLDVHENTVRRWVDDGKLTAVRTGGGHRRINTASLKKFL